VPVPPLGRLATAGVVVGLVLVSCSAGPESTRLPPAWFTAALGGLVVVVGGAGVALYRRGGSIPLAVAGALAFSGAAMAARALASSPVDVLHLLADPLTWMVVAFGIAGAVLYARSLERGAVGPATAALWVIEVVVPGAVGVLVLGDTVRSGTAVPALVGVVLAVVGTVVLARSGAGEPGPEASPSPAGIGDGSGSGQG
jgi:hypothetical protein